MRLSPNIVTEIKELIAFGKTEQAIVRLRKCLEEEQVKDSIALHQILLLSGQYHTWEAEKIGGIRDDNKELARINNELLRLLDNLADPDNQAQAYSPTTEQSDTFQRNSVNAQHQPTVESTSISKQTLKYASYFFISMGIVFVTAIAYTIATENEIDTTHQGALIGDVIESKQLNEEQQGLEDPIIDEDFPLVDSDEVLPTNTGFEPKVSHLLTEQARDNMLDLIQSGRLLNIDELKPIASNHARLSFGGTRWFEDETSYVIFADDGLSATYLNSSGSIGLQYYTTQGFYLGAYTDLAKEDSGVLAIVPPGQANTMTVYIESHLYDVRKIIELERR